MRAWEGVDLVSQRILISEWNCESHLRFLPCICRFSSYMKTLMRSTISGRTFPRNLRAEPRGYLFQRWRPRLGVKPMNISITAKLSVERKPVIGQTPIDMRGRKPAWEGTEEVS